GRVVTEALTVHPFSPVTVTCKLLAVVTGIEGVVASFHTRRPSDLEAVRVVEGTEQLRSSPLLSAIAATGTELSSVVVTEALAVHPFSPATVTVKVSAVVTVIEAVVAPFDQR